MFNLAEDFAMNKISCTGARAIVMLGLLIASPRTMEEIREIFLKLNLITEKSSKDILRIDMNSLKHIGCKITNSSPQTNNKYVLLNHPYALEFTENEIKLLKKVYRQVKKTSDIKLLIDFDFFFKKISNYVFDDNTKEMLLGISDLRYFKNDFVQDLYYASEHQYQLDLIYNLPTTRKDVRKQVVAKKLVMQNGKIYLYGFDAEKLFPIVLNVKRIKEIISRTFKKSNSSGRDIKIKFSLKTELLYLLNSEEVVIEQKEDFSIVEATYYNDFLAIQRVLSFGKDCVVIEPEDFKSKVIYRLKKMRDVYGS